LTVFKSKFGTTTGTTKSILDVPMNMSFQFSRPQNPQSSVLPGSFMMARREDMGLSVPSDRWNKGKQGIEILASIHQNERTGYAVLNKRLNTHENLIHSIIHGLILDLGNAPSVSILSRKTQTRIDDRCPHIVWFDIQPVLC
jgi:hypothetical protein